MFPEISRRKHTFRTFWSPFPPNSMLRWSNGVWFKQHWNGGSGGHAIKDRSNAILWLVPSILTKTVWKIAITTYCKCYYNSKSTSVQQSLLLWTDSHLVWAKLQSTSEVTVFIVTGLFIRTMTSSNYAKFPHCVLQNSPCVWNLPVVFVWKHHSEQRGFENKVVFRVSANYAPPQCKRLLFKCTLTRISTDSFTFNEISFTPANLHSPLEGI